MGRTGGSLIKAAKAYLDKGAIAVYAVLTHGVLPAGSVAKLKAAGVFKAIYVTNTHPSAVAQADDFLVVNSIATLLTDKVLKSRAELI
jgi:ribose-phosphate pyrophosphokinase